MFKDNHLILFLLCILPVIFYSIAIFLNSPSFSIRLKSSFTYLYTGFLSITILQFIFFIFPHIQDKMFQIHEGGFDLQGVYFDVYQPTLSTLLFFAFIQIALIEEFSKWVAFKCSNYMRGSRRNRMDHPYAVMFYSALISAGFAVVENVQYAQRAIYGEFGQITPEAVVAGRGLTSVIVHMACGLFMGYYIALSKNSTTTKKILYNVLGISAATFMHGIYDFNCMKPTPQSDYFNLFGILMIDLSSIFIICFCLTTAFLMSWNLKSVVHKDELEHEA